MKVETALEQLRAAMKDQMQGELVARNLALELELKSAKADLARTDKKFRMKVDKLEARVREWKANYSRTRKLLLLAQAEIKDLKRGKYEQDAASI